MYIKVCIVLAFAVVGISGEAVVRPECTPMGYNRMNDCYGAYRNGYRCSFVRPQPQDLLPIRPSPTPDLLPIRPTPTPDLLALQTARNQELLSLRASLRRNVPSYISSFPYEDGDLGVSPVPYPVTGDASLYANPFARGVYPSREFEGYRGGGYY